MSPKPLSVRRTESVCRRWGSAADSPPAHGRQGFSARQPQNAKLHADKFPVAFDYVFVFSLAKPCCCDSTLKCKHDLASNQRAF